MEMENTVDVYGTVYDLRMHRSLMVQTEVWADCYSKRAKQELDIGSPQLTTVTTELGL